MLSRWWLGWSTCRGVYALSLTLAMALQGFGEVWSVYGRFVRFEDLVHVTLALLT